MIEIKTQYKRKSRTMLDRKPTRTLMQELKRDEMLINDDLKIEDYEIESQGNLHSS